MNGGETIINRINADGDAAVAAIKAEADKANAAVLAEAEKEAQRRAQAIADKTAQKCAQSKTASKSRCDLAVRSALLRQRRSEIDKTVDMLLDYLTNLDDSAYFDALYKLAAQLRGKSGVLSLNQKDLNRLPADFTDKVRAAGLDATVSDAPADITGGFILKNGDIEENMDFRALISARRDEIEDFINRELFRQ